MSAKLFLIGVGPGDPQLLTLRAAKILKDARFVAFLRKPGTTSMALGIAKDHLQPGIALLPMDVPMQVAPQAAQNAYDLAAAKISALLDQEKSVTYLCEGDPFFYGSAMYLFNRLSPAYEIEVVPGISSLGAASAAIPRPLVSRAQHLKVLSATMPEQEFEDELLTAQSVVVMKTGRHFLRIKNVLIKSGLAQNALIVEHASGAEQAVTPLLEYKGDCLPYFATILSFKGNGSPEKRGLE
ncbi:MAG: precorrin-2 C(20)-methyltransferase [Devosiaceae bacterium]|nr:precorrin-2 C(20)-methyltransferase [Devosiaceae bacterium]